MPKIWLKSSFASSTSVECQSYYYLVSWVSLLPISKKNIVFVLSTQSLNNWMKDLIMVNID